MRAVLITIVAPVAWGSTYYVTRQFLPADAPVWGAAARALPAGIVLLLIARRLPVGGWWWRSCVLGLLNVGGFFCLVYIAAQRLPSSVASIVMAAAPLVMAAMAWALNGERPKARASVASVIGLLGVVLVVEGGTGRLDATGLAASAAAMLSSSLGFVLNRRWADATPAPVVALTAWQMTAGGGGLLVAAAVVEGAPPDVGGSGIAAYAYLSLVATALAFVCWFYGLARLDVGTVGVIGLLNPVTGVLLGTVLAAEVLTTEQVIGMVVVLAAVALSAGVFARVVGSLRRAGAERQDPA